VFGFVMALSETDLVVVLGPFLPAELARNMVRRAFLHCNASGDISDERDVERVIDAMMIGINLFIATPDRARVRAAVQGLAGPALEVVARSLEIRGPTDALAARTEGRTIAVKLGARSLIAQKVSTVIGALAQVLLKHCGGGVIDIEGNRKDPKHLLVGARSETETLPAVEKNGLASVRDTVDRFAATRDRIEVHIYV
jgi:hypothetical protein